MKAEPQANPARDKFHERIHANHMKEQRGQVLDLGLRARERERAAHNCSLIGMVNHSRILSVKGRAFHAS